MSKNLSQFTSGADLQDTDKLVGHRGTGSGMERGWLWSLIKSTLRTVWQADDTAIASAAATDATTKANAAQAAAIQRGNHTGTQSADTLVDGTTNKAFLATERTKLTGIATGATANSSDATLLARANHTGTQTMSTISDAGTAATKNVAVSGDASATEVVKGNDSRLTNDRTPTAGSVVLASLAATGTGLQVLRRNSGNTALEFATVSAGGGDLLASNNLSDVVSAATAFSNIKQPATTTATGVVELATDGEAIAGVVVQGNDSRLSNARTPSAHATSHKSGGSDAIKLDELAAPTDVTTLDATTSQHGLLPKLGGGTTNFLRADGTWATPAGGGGGTSLGLINAIRLGYFSV